jgi:hypothetical protein
MCETPRVVVGGPVTQTEHHSNIAFDIQHHIAEHDFASPAVIHAKTSPSDRQH